MGHLSGVSAGAQDGERPTRADRLVLVLGAAGVLIAIGLRVWHRGENLPGWDYLLATEGQYLLATRGWWGAIRETLVQTRHFWLPPAAYSLPYGLVPGALTIAVPWLFWQPLVVAILWLVTLALLLCATGWSLTSSRGVGVALLAWGAWPAGLSYAVQGYPWANCLLPYAVALLVVLHPRIRRSVGWTALGAALVYEIPWHSYELAKTVGCVFVLAALLEHDVRWPVRGLWLLAAAIQIGDAYWWHQSTNLLAFRRGNVGAGMGIQHAFPFVFTGVAEVFRQVYVTQAMALPILLTAGALSLVVLRQHRAFLTALWLAQLALVILLAASGADLLRARRFLLVEGMSLVVLLAALRTAGPAWRRSLIGLLLVGNAWALWGLATFMREPLGVPRSASRYLASSRGKGSGWSTPPPSPGRRGSRRGPRQASASCSSIARGVRPRIPPTRSGPWSGCTSPSGTRGSYARSSRSRCRAVATCACRFLSPRTSRGSSTRSRSDNGSIWTRPVESRWLAPWPRWRSGSDWSPRAGRGGSLSSFWSSDDTSTAHRAHPPRPPPSRRARGARRRGVPLPGRAAHVPRLGRARRLDRGGFHGARASSSRAARPACPRGAWYTHRNLLAVVDIERRRHPGGIPPFQTSLAAGLSFAHVGTMTRIGLQIAHLGALVVHDTFDAAAVLETAERERLKQLGGIPTQLVLLLDHPDRPCRRAKGWWTSENGALNEAAPAVR